MEKTLLGLIEGEKEGWEEWGQGGTGGDGDVVPMGRDVVTCCNHSGRPQTTSCLSPLPPFYPTCSGREETACLPASDGIPLPSPSVPLILYLWKKRKDGGAGSRKNEKYVCSVLCGEKVVGL